MKITAASATFLAASAASADVLTPDAELLDFSRTQWEVGPEVSDDAIISTFNAAHYDLNWRDWAAAFDSRFEIRDALAEEDYERAYDAAKIYGTGLGYEAVENAALKFLDPLVAAPIIGWANKAFTLSLDLIRISAEVEAYRHQHDLYFSIRPYNSYDDIVNARPFDLFDGPNIVTKEGNGWLFVQSGYLLPRPSNMGPEEFWPLAESQWFFANEGDADLLASSDFFASQFQAAVAVPEPSLLALLAPSLLLIRRRAT